ncbi:MAG: universal stress protein [Maribacter sp.]|nr:universal stress protein [Maribacter sp.]
MKNILIPTDFSRNAWKAIAYALQFFKNEKCTFYILHTYTPIFYRIDYMMGGPAFSAIPDMGVDIAQAGLDKTYLDIKLKYPNERHSFKLLSSFNTLTEEIQEVVQREKIDLIVMGTQGATGAKEIFLGTHTVNVIRKSKVPVIAVPLGYRFKAIKSIVFPTDYLSLYIKKDLQCLIDTAKMFQAELKIVHVIEDTKLTDEQKAHKTALEKYFNSLDCSFEEVKGAYMPNAVYEYIDKHHCGLLAMMNRDHSFLERLFIKQNIDAIGFHSKIPFLVMRDSAKINQKN